MSVLFSAIEQITVEVPSRPNLNFIANVPIKAPARVVQTTASIWGLDEDQIAEMVLRQTEHAFDTHP